MMKKRKKDEDFEFGDLEEDDAYDESDIPLDKINWKKVEKLQKIIDELPEEGAERKTAAYKLQDELRGDK